ncbi:hypothetical protein HBI25_163220 [Parastagonospora nodorum]|nr:hypothetical protein HBH53_032070 [Parastagonospora nodorum]KAH3969338.1 hypothetical protein HBH51_124240 [Parastagonospora nodorum]KAH3990770.1 hypothetical protein HBH52_009080 [Parastagonospora nodorum]KAH4006555.1 hypothetical protein HBI10_019500 [Parastagonospora nodorum]KAH4015301.1 hypothetical protein HBI13_161140 [Parastagonospora nodorum]
MPWEDELMHPSESIENSPHPTRDCQEGSKERPLDLFVGVRALQSSFATACIRGVVSLGGYCRALFVCSAMRAANTSPRQHNTHSSQVIGPCTQDTPSR